MTVSFNYEPEDVPTIERHISEYMMAGLVDQSPEWFEGGDVNRSAMVASTMIAFNLGFAGEPVVRKISREMQEWWNGLGIEVAPTEADYFK
jgi:hypothetical protein